jgi:hypothetical protein
MSEPINWRPPMSSAQEHRALIAAAYDAAVAEDAYRATRTSSALADAMIAGLDEKYDLVYVDYRDQFSDDQVAALVRGDLETLWDKSSEWESNAREESITEILKQVGDDVIRDWQIDDERQDLDEGDYEPLVDGFFGTEEYERVRDAIDQRDRAQWPTQMAGQTPAVLLRIAAAEIDEDNAFTGGDVAADHVLMRLGAAPTEENTYVVQEMLKEADYPGAVLMGYWIVGADVSDVYKLPTEPDTLVEIVNPHLYMGNPFAGTGMITDGPLTHTVRVRRDQLRTDAEAFGHAVTEVFGGLNPSSFAATITAVPAEEGNPS